MRYVFVALCGLLLRACASRTVLSLAPFDAAETHQGKESFLLSYVSNRDGCDLIIGGKKTNRDYALRMDPQDKVARYRIGPGSYVLKRIDCGKGGKFEPLMPAGDVEITVRPQKTHYLGSFKVIEGEAASRGDNQLLEDGLRMALSILSTGEKSAVVSAYTGRPINVHMDNANSGLRWGFRYSSAAEGKDQQELEGAKVEARLYPKLAGCVKDEAESNPLILGKLKVVGTYRAGRAPLVNEASYDGHTLSRTFRDCLRAVLEDYQQAAKPGLKIEMDFG